MSRDGNNIQLWFAKHPDLVLDVQSFTVVEQISGLFSINVVARTGESNLDLDTIVDSGAAFSLNRGDRGATGTRLWSGICSQITHVSAHDEGLSEYVIEVVPELWRLTLRKNSRIFQHASIPEIAVHLLKDWGIEEGAQLKLRNFKSSDYGRFPKFEYRVQYEETDYEFFARLLAEAGIAFYFEFTNEAHGKGRDTTKLILDSDAEKATEQGQQSKDEEGGGGSKTSTTASGGGGGNQQPRAGGDSKMVIGPLAYRGQHGDASFGLPESIVANAATGRTVRPGSVTIIDHDFRLTPIGTRAQERAKAEVKTTEPKYEMFRYAPGLLQHEESREEGDKFVLARNQPHATNALQGLRADDMLTQFETNELDVAPGSVVKFGQSATGLDAGAEHPREELGAERKHLVVRSKIAGDRMGRWYLHCFAVTAERPYRPVPIAQKPRIYGVQSALVVGPKSAEKEQIHCDRYGRVRVQFHWDRQHKYGEPLSGDEGKDLDALGSCWVRVATPWAGAGYGFVAIPRVGHEVLVSYLDGDPDHPMIVGSLYNEANPPPYALPGAKTISGMRTNSSANGQGFNELYFDDKKGAELVHIQAQNALSTVVKSSESHSVGASRTTMVGAEDVLHVGQKWELAVGQNETGVSATTNAISIQVGGAQGAQITLSGPNIFINALGELHMHSGGDMHLSAQGAINIDGATVNINCGSPHAAAATAFAKASPPAAGSSIPGGPKPAGGGGMPDVPGRITADVNFDEAHPADAAGVGGGSSGSGSSGSGSGLGGERGLGGLSMPTSSPLAAAASSVGSAIGSAPSSALAGAGSMIKSGAESVVRGVATAAMSGGHINMASVVSGGLSAMRDQGIKTVAEGVAGAVVPSAVADIAKPVVQAAVSSAIGGGKVAAAAVAAAKGAATSAVVDNTVGKASSAVSSAFRGTPPHAGSGSSSASAAAKPTAETTPTPEGEGNGTPKEG